MLFTFSCSLPEPLPSVSVLAKEQNRKRKSQPRDHFRWINRFLQVVSHSSGPVSNRSKVNGQNPRTRLNRATNLTQVLGKAQQVWPLTHFFLFAFCKKKVLIRLEGSDNLMIIDWIKLAD